MLGVYSLAQSLRCLSGEDEEEEVTKEKLIEFMINGRRYKLEARPQSPLLPTRDATEADLAAAGYVSISLLEAVRLGAGNIQGELRVERDEARAALEEARVAAEEARVAAEAESVAAHEWAQASRQDRAALTQAQRERDEARALWESEREKRKQQDQREASLLDDLSQAQQRIKDLEAARSEALAVSAKRITELPAEQLEPEE